MTSSFDNYPIEFKEINPEDFNLGGARENNRFIVDDKIIITPNEQGYINDEIQNNIDLNLKNTVVINAGVGQGKSYAIIKTIERYYQKIEQGEKYLLIVASPFVSLVKQYVEDIHKDGNIPQEQIFNYNSLGRDEVNYLDKSVHVVTVNTLLGNPGEDGFKNSEVKREYLAELSKHCIDNQIKVVFIYDELHDSYHNFKQEYIFSLWKWEKVIHKNFIISATFNEASKIVIKYLAELTDFKIKIIESERIRFKEKQSKLFLHYSTDFSFTVNTKEIRNVIFNLLESNKDIDILCYSKSLSKDLMNKNNDIGKKLLKVYGKNNIQNCTSELVGNSREENAPPTNQYNKQARCNIGTNFKTGVSINKPNHSLVIIMPPPSSKLQFKNQYGIFSGGVNSVIQALARQRTNQSIHIILPKPVEFNYKSLEHTGMNELQIKEFKKIYSELINKKEDKKKDQCSYFNFNQQYILLKHFYESKLRIYVENEITKVSRLDRGNLPTLKFKDFEQFILEEGEDYLSSSYKIFGEDISSYITYASITNQFLNCKLEKINVKKALYFEEENIHKQISDFNNNHHFEERLEMFKSYGTFKSYSKEFRKLLYEEYLVYIKRKDSSVYVSNKMTKKIFEKKLLYWLSSKFYGKIENFTRAEYLLNCMLVATKKEDIDSLPTESKNRILLFKALAHFTKKLFSMVEFHKKYYFIRTKFDNIEINNEDLEHLQMVEQNLIKDEYLINVYNNISRNLKNKSPKDKIITLLNILRRDFLILEKRKNKLRPTLLDSKGNKKKTSVMKVLGYYCIPSKKIDFINEYVDFERIEQENKDYLGEEKYNELLEQIDFEELERKVKEQHGF